MLCGAPRCACLRQCPRSPQTDPSCQPGEPLICLAARRRRGSLRKPLIGREVVFLQLALLLIDESSRSLRRDGRHGPNSSEIGPGCVKLNSASITSASKVRSCLNRGPMDGRGLGSPSRVTTGRLWKRRNRIATGKHLCGKSVGFARLECPAGARKSGRVRRHDKGGVCRGSDRCGWRGHRAWRNK